MWDWIITNRDWIFSGIGVLLISALTSFITFYISTVKYQAWKEKRQDKIAVFKHLMATRNINDYERVKAINSIDIIFNDCTKVTEACVVYINAMKEYEKAVDKAYEEAKKENKSEPNEVNNKAVIDGEINLLKEIAVALGYKNVNVNAIVHNSFQPNWLYERRNMDYFMLSKINQMVKTAEVQGGSFTGVNWNNARLCPNCQKKVNSMRNSICKNCKVMMESVAKGQ